MVARLSRTSQDPGVVELVKRLRTARASLSRLVNLPEPKSTTPEPVMPPPAPRVDPPAPAPAPVAKVELSKPAPVVTPPEPARPAIPAPKVSNTGKKLYYTVQVAGLIRKRA